MSTEQLGPVARYDVARTSLRTLPTFAEIETAVAEDLGRPIEPNECVAIIATLDAVSRGLVRSIGIPFEPPPPPPTKAREDENRIAQVTEEDLAAAIKDGIREGSDPDGAS